ncbi:MAG: Asp23/Gls24 family envelope stress response protein [Oscillospiraceae bacterium]|nr:Asp23/Gls24 family envelope stress response protein [Oscillospiraceae bacterium]
METSKKHTPGSIKVSEEVILKIAETAACEIEGVAVKGQRLEASSALSKFRGPVRARILGEAAAIKFDISVIDGYNAVKVAESIQHSVKSAVQNMTGFTVTKVDVNIAGVSYRESERLSADEKDKENI